MNLNFKTINKITDALYFIAFLYDGQKKKVAT